LSVVAIAHDAGCRVGVDAERTDSPLTCIPADVALSPAEREHVEGVSSLHQPQEFLKLWTLKEAYMKLRGCGVGVGLEQVEVALSPARLVRTEEGHEPPTDLHLETRPIHTAAGVYCVSLAVQCPPGVRPQVTFHLLETLWPDPREGRRLPVEGVVESRPDEEAR
jgi:phosphopantetheinyl transferase